MTQRQSQNIKQLHRKKHIHFKLKLEIRVVNRHQILWTASKSFWIYRRLRWGLHILKRFGPFYISSS